VATAESWLSTLVFIVLNVASEALLNAVLAAVVAVMPACDATMVVSGETLVTTGLLALGDVVAMLTIGV